jgi:LysM repeat protein
MKILKMIGLVVAVHVVVLTFGFILPGCQSTARTSPSSSERTTDSNLSRIDAARAAGAVGQPAAYTPDYTPAPARAPGGVPAYTPPPPGPAFTGGPVTDFSTPVSAPARPQPAAEAPALPAADAAPPEMLTYTVATGDSLWKISRKFKIKSADIISVNNLSNSSLQVGQKLKIPAKTISSKPGLTAQPGTIVYKVQASDSLGIIARRHNTTVAQIQSLNKLTNASIRIGQELLVPVIADAPDASAPLPAVAADAPAPQSVTITHIVKPGENLDGIARHYGTTAKEIGIANHIPDPRRLQAGKKLTINARKNATTGTPAPAPAATPSDATGATQSTPPPTSTPPSLPPPADTSPVNPVSPVTDSPVAPAAGPPAYDTPPVTTPLDPATSPVGIPQN